MVVVHFGCRLRAVLLDKVNITFKQGDEELRVQAPEGKTLLDIALDNNVDIEGEHCCGSGVRLSSLRCPVHDFFVGRKQALVAESWLARLAT